MTAPRSRDEPWGLGFALSWQWSWCWRSVWVWRPAVTAGTTLTVAAPGVLGVARLAFPQLLVEIEATAVD